MLIVQMRKLSVKYTDSFYYFKFNKGVKMYREIYKCKLCGYIFEKGMIENKTEADIKINELKGKDILRIHYCEGENIGIAELLGYKIYIE